MSRNTALAAALAALLLTFPAVDAQAQSRTSTSRGQHPATDDEDAPSDSKGKVEAPLYPDTGRPEPSKSKASARISKLYELMDKKKLADAIARADAVIADPDASGVERAYAAYIAGYAARDLDSSNYSKAIDYMQQAVDADQLANNTHFSTMYEIAQLQLHEQKYADALKTVDRFLSETHSSDPHAYAVKGNALFRLARYPEAIAALKQANPDGKDQQVNDMLLRAYVESKQLGEAAKFAEGLAGGTPDDKRAQLDLAVVYQNAGLDDKAAAVFERLRAAGKLTEPSDYEQGYAVLSRVDGKEAATAAFINEGLTKGMLKPSATVYGMLGQSQYFSDPPNIPGAIAAWEKGAPLAKDGEMYLNLSKARNESGGNNFSAIRDAAKSAIAQGVKHPGEAWSLVATAARGTGDKAAEIAAWREAAKDPATRDQANRQIKALGGK